MIKAEVDRGLNPSLKSHPDGQQGRGGRSRKNKPHPGSAKGWTAAKPARSVRNKLRGEKPVKAPLRALGDKPVCDCALSLA